MVDTFYNGIKLKRGSKYKTRDGRNVVYLYPLPGISCLTNAVIQGSVYGPEQYPASLLTDIESAKK